MGIEKKKLVISVSIVIENDYDIKTLKEIVEFCEEKKFHIEGVTSYPVPSFDGLRGAALSGLQNK